MSAALFMVIGNPGHTIPQPGYSCCNRRTVSPEPDKQCNLVVATYDQYYETYDCDDANGWRDTNTTYPVYKTIYPHVASGNLAAGTYIRLYVNGVLNAILPGGSTVDAASGQTGVQFVHNGGCYAHVESNPVQRQVYMDAFRVGTCSGGGKDRSLIEVVFGDL